MLNSRGIAEDDCGDYSDEVKCDHSHVYCKQWQFHCKDRCIPDYWKCDGMPDCLDGEDEAKCTSKPGKDLVQGVVYNLLGFIYILLQRFKTVKHGRQWFDILWLSKNILAQYVRVSRIKSEPGQS